MTSTNIDTSCYILKFGKYKDMLACDIVDLQKFNKKGETVNTGLSYSQSLVTCSWFKDVDLIQSIIDEYTNEHDVGYVYEIEPEPEIEQKKQKKKEKEKKSKEITKADLKLILD